MTTRSQSPSDVAAEIRSRLEGAAAGASAPATGAAPVAPPSATTVNSTRLTKDGTIVPPGEPVPRDANGNEVAFQAIPDATFHLGGS